MIHPLQRSTAARSTAVQSHNQLHTRPLCCVRLTLFCASDVKDITTVVNYDMPNNMEDYVHRIGRTARAGAHGTAYSFFTSENAKSARELIKLLREAGQEVPAELERFSYGGGGGSSGGRGRYGGGGGYGGRGGGYRGGYGGGGGGCGAGASGSNAMGGGAMRS